MRSRTFHGNSIASGFTLIELLSAMVVMSLMMALASMSLSQFSQYSDKSGLGFEARINRYLNLERMGELLSKTLDYYVDDNLGKKQVFFSGKRELMKFVSSTSWESGEQATLNYLVVEQDEDALQSLVLYQRPLTNNVFFEVAQFPEKGQLPGMLVLNGASKITFDYLGIENIRQIYPSGTTQNFTENLRWKYRYEGKEKGYIPQKIRVNVEWPDGTIWPCIVDVKALNYSKRGLMLDGSS